MSEQLQEFVLPAGMVVTLEGIPVELTARTLVYSTEENMLLVENLIHQRMAKEAGCSNGIRKIISIRPPKAPEVVIMDEVVNSLAPMDAAENQRAAEHQHRRVQAKVELERKLNKTQNAEWED